MSPKTLRQLLRNVPLVGIQGDLEAPIQSISADSRKVRPQTLFIAIQGTQTDGNQFIQEALEKGAVALVSQKPPPSDLPENISYIQVSNDREAYAIIAANFWDNPGKSLKLIGITGTNGKTTTATFIYQMLNTLQIPVGLLSTIQWGAGNQWHHASLTTPDPMELHKILHTFFKKGIRYVVMEVSSHALEQKRVAGLYFDAAIFTNLSRDHLDYHTSFKHYRDAKKQLFDAYVSPNAVVCTNVDDKHGYYMVQNTPAKQVFTYGLQRPAQFHAKIIEETLEGTTLLFRNREVSFTAIGRFNVYNWLAATATLIALGFDEEQVCFAGSQVHPPAGRLERFALDRGRTAIIDYAHTPDALKKVLETLKPLAGKGKIVSVFGAGGNRDRGKRPQMAKVAAYYSDYLILTSDNPRFEDPQQILQDLYEGVPHAKRSQCFLQPDRRQAIRLALQIAPENSLILIAGKGHETYQEIQGVRHPFDDRKVLLEEFYALSSS